MDSSRIFLVKAAEGGHGQATGIQAWSGVSAGLPWPLKGPGLFLLEVG